MQNLDIHGLGQMAESRITRRSLLRNSGLGLGMLGVCGGFGGEGAVMDALNPSLRPLNNTGRRKPGSARRLIHIFADGGPSHVDTFDPKPMLARCVGKPLPASVGGDSAGSLMPSGFYFQRYGESGIEISEVFSELGEHADDLCVIRSMHTLNSHHEQMRRLLINGSVNVRHPSLGFRIAEILGRAHKNLPASVVLCSGKSSTGTEVLLDAVHRTPIADTTVCDLSSEPRSVWNSYGDGAHGRQLMIARRLIEQDVSYVQVLHGMDGLWDHHHDIENRLTACARPCSRSISALLADLKTRGLFEDTLVLWSGEFGRSPAAERYRLDGRGTLYGRGHSHRGFSIWMAGGGVKGGYVHGRTDDFGYAAIEDRVNPHDLHATIHRLMGFHCGAGGDRDVLISQGDVITGVVA